MMLKPLFFLTLAAAGGIAFAAEGDTDRAARRADMQARMEAKFAAADVDRDGSLDRVEAQALDARFAEGFARIDADGNGELTKDELRAAHRGHGRGERGGRGGRGMSYMAGLFKGMDDDGNDAISRAELGTKMPTLAENFAAIDTDRNNELSRGELRAHHAAMRADHGDAEGHDHHHDHDGAATPAPAAH